MIFQATLSPKDLDLATGTVSTDPSTAPSTGNSDDLHSRLLLHWKKATASTISRNDTDLELWQTKVPNEALSNPCLMHGIYAVSAIHMALIHPGSERGRWIRTAEYHQSESIKLFTSLLEDEHKRHHIGSFFVSSLLIGCAFAFPLAISKPTHEISDPLNEIIQLMAFIKSCLLYTSDAADEMD